jgi:hypothetical protein
MKTDEEETRPSERLVNLGELCVIRLGEEKGTLKTSDENRNVPSPKYHSRCSAQTPWCLAITTIVRFLASSTIILVARTVGSTFKMSFRLVTLAYENANVKTERDTAYETASHFVSINGEPVR